MRFSLAFAKALHAWAIWLSQAKWVFAGDQKGSEGATAGFSLTVARTKGIQFSGVDERG